MNWVGAIVEQLSWILPLIGLAGLVFLPFVLKSWGAAKKRRSRGKAGAGGALGVPPLDNGIGDGGIGGDGGGGDGGAG
jgi:hypothetical protein